MAKLRLLIVGMHMIGLLNSSDGLDILDCVGDLMEHWQKNILIHKTRINSDEAVQAFKNKYADVLVATLATEGGKIESVENSVLVLSAVKTSDPVPSKQFTLVPEVPDSWKLRLDSQVIQYEIKEDEIIFHDIYSVKNNQKRIKMYFGKWRKDEGFTTTRQSKFWNDRTDLRNVTLVAAIMDYAPVFFNTENIIGGNGIPMGFVASLLEELQKRFQFDIKYVKPPDGLWAGKDKDGQWNGMGKMMIDGEADLAPSGLSISMERLEIMDFTNPLLNDMMSLWSKVATDSTINIWVYLDIFTMTSSIALIVMVLLLAIGFLMIQATEAADHVDYNLFLSELAIIGVVVMQRDHPIQPVRLPTKLLWISTCFFGFLIFAFFSAVLTSSMTIRPPPFQIREFSDILSYDFTMVVWYGTIAHSSLAGSPKGSTERRIFEETMLTRQDDTLFLQKSEIHQAVLNNPRTVYFGNMFSLGGFQGVKFNIIKDAYATPLAIAFQKNSEFLELFNSELARFDEMGIIRKLKQKWIDAPNKDEVELVSAESTSLGYDNVLFPFIICVTGVCLAIVLTFLEKVKKARRQKISRSTLTAWT